MAWARIMKYANIHVGRVYRFYPNGRKPFEVVRVEYKGGGDFMTIKGPRRIDVPYNFATAANMRHPSRAELQSFLGRMPRR